MKIIVSPAKSLDFTLDLPTKSYSQPLFLEQTQRIHKLLVNKRPRYFQKLMNISKELAELNWQRYQDWSVQPTKEKTAPAVFVFRGSVYLGLDAYSLSQEKIDVLQDKVRILSGFYGLLKPLDLIQAHRLEMGTELKIGRKKNLYQFWGKLVTGELSKEMQSGEHLINLASNEYFKAITKKNFKNPIITPVFQDTKNGKLKVISFFAKKARGMMVRFILDNKIEELEDIKKFDYGNYQFDASLSTANKYVFTREEQTQ